MGLGKDGSQGGGVQATFKVIMVMPITIITMEMVRYNIFEHFVHVMGFITL